MQVSAVLQVHNGCRTRRHSRAAWAVLPVLTAQNAAFGRKAAVAQDKRVGAVPPRAD
jgi:hypothetical protein